MSSMRNAVQRRNHKERAQPLERQKWGLLEKHSDYSKRAADHNLKKRKLAALRQKASDRNEDEFYFGMMSSGTKDGVKRAKRGEENSGGGGKVLREETVRLMKEQDEGYLRTVLGSTRKVRERVEREVKMGEVGVSGAGGGITPVSAGKKVVFGDDGEDLPAVPAAASSDDDDLDGLYDDSEVESELEEETEGLSKEEINTRRRKRRNLAAKQSQLSALRDREEQLTTALREIEAQRARMHGTVGGVNKNGVKFKPRERKR